MKKRVDWLKLVIALAIPQIAAFLGSLFTITGVDTWYTTLVRPAFAPPNWIFAPVWTILFVLMGISLYLVWVNGWKKKNIRIAIYLFFVQLLFNVIWSVLFFGLHNPLLAFIEIVLLWVLIALTIQKFMEISKTAGYLLIPYILWVSFALLLNFAFFILN